MANPIVSRKDWLEARKALLAKEKEFTRQRDALAAERRALPWVEVTEDYRFTTEDGARSLGELFNGKSQLIVQHFMFGPDWKEGCPSCSFWSDNFDGLDVHLEHRDISFVLVSRAPLEKLLAYKARMGWRHRWVSSLGTTFNEDFGVTFTPEQRETGQIVYNYRVDTFPSDEAPGVSVFLREGERIVHTYSTYGRGLDILNSAYHLMDLAPKGRDEQDLPYSMAWLRRRDQYDLV